MGLVKPIGTLERGLTKQGLIELAETNAAEVIQSDKYDLLKVYVEMKRYELYFKTVMEKLREAALAKAQEIGLKSFEYADAHVTNAKRTVYVFDNDPTWRKLNEKYEHIKSLLKQHEELLKQLVAETGVIVDEETAEMVEIVAPTKQVQESITVKF